jgi:hypothetical protein
MALQLPAWIDRIRRSYLAIAAVWAIVVLSWSRLLGAGEGMKVWEFVFFSFFFFPIWLFTYLPSTVISVCLWAAAMGALKAYTARRNIEALSGWNFLWIANISLALTLVAAITIFPIAFIMVMGKVFGIWPGL